MSIFDRLIHVSPRLLLRIAVCLIFCTIGILSAYLLMSFYEGEKYTDEDLYDMARNFLSEGVSMPDLEIEAMKYFENADLWGSKRRSVWPCEGSEMYKIGRILPASTCYWCPVEFENKYALALRFGCHSNYAYLLVVNQKENISEHADVRLVENNVVIVYDSALLQGY